MIFLFFYIKTLDADDHGPWSNGLCQKEFLPMPAVEVVVYEEEIPEEARNSSPDARWVVHEGCVNAGGVWFPRREWESFMCDISDKTRRYEAKKWFQAHPKRDKLFDDLDSAGVAQFVKAVELIDQNVLPLMFDLDGHGVENCARKFALDNGIPYDRLNVGAFESLARIRTVRDVVSSSLLMSSAKTAIRRCLLNAFDRNEIRTIYTQNIVVPLVHPTPSEIDDAFARIDIRSCPYAGGHKTMGELPFFSRCISCKFLVFVVSPGGDVALSPNMYTNSSFQDMMDASRSTLSYIQNDRETRVRNRLRRKLQKSNVAESPPVRGIDLWKRALELVRPTWRKDREDRMRTAQNRVQTRKQQIVRERVAFERATDVRERAKTLPKVAWAEQAPGPSERAKTTGRKAERLARRKAALAAQRQEQMKRAEEQMRVEAERLRNLQIADAILHE